jgi:hypothetical protein
MSDPKPFMGAAHRFHPSKAVMPCMAFGMVWILGSWIHSSLES